MDPGGQRKRLVHAGITYIEDVARQDLEFVEYSFHNFGMGLWVSDVRGAKHEVEIFPQFELFEKFEGRNGAVCRQGGLKMLMGQFEKRDKPRFASKVVVERAEIDSFEVFEGAVEIPALTPGQVNERLADRVHVYVFLLVRSYGRPPYNAHDMGVEVGIGLSRIEKNSVTVKRYYLEIADAGDK
jgi:hypothetical protein